MALTLWSFSPTVSVWLLQYPFVYEAHGLMRMSETFCLPQC